jgi:hypothetical protein
LNNDEDKVRWEKALQLARWLVVTYDGSVGPKQLVTQQVNLAKAPYLTNAPKGQGLGGIYGGHRLYYPKFGSNKTPISPLKLVQSTFRRTLLILTGQY